MKGEVVYLYAFDVAQEIVTAKVQEILTRKPFPFAVRHDHTFPKDVPLYRPLAIEPPPPAALLHGQPVRLLIRVYDVGVVTVAVRVAFEGVSLRDLMAFHEPALADGQSLDQLARDLCTQVCESLKDFLVQGAPPTEPEAYTAFCLTEVGGAPDVQSWLIDERRVVAGLLTG